MSRKGVAIPPPPNLDGGINLSFPGEFAVPLPPSQPKPAAVNNSGNSQAVRKRKSRFSDAPPSTNAPPPTVLEVIPTPQKKANITEGSTPDKAASVSAAAAAAARINANLLARGKIKSMPLNSQLTSQSTARSSDNDDVNPAANVEISNIDDMYSAEVEINDVPIGCRNYLTRLSTQESINKSYMAYVSTRGKYISPEEKKQHPLLMGGERPLYLHVKSQSETNVKKALERIKLIINNHFEKKSKYQSEALAQIASLSKKSIPGAVTEGATNSLAQAFTPGYPLIPTTTTTPLSMFQPTLPSGNYVQEKLFIGLDSLPEHCDVKNKLIGPNYRNFNFISNQTGAKVILRGKGSGFIEPTSNREAFESMHAFISHPNQAGVNAAKELVWNLLETVKAELGPYAQISSQNTMPTGYNFTQSQGDYRSVPPPPMPVPAPTSESHKSNPMTAYPFQHANTPNISAQSSTQAYDTTYNSDVLGYQHNSAGTDYYSRSSTRDNGRPKERQRKRFTEETSTPIPPSMENSSTCSDQTTATSSGKTSLPFWMTP